MELPADFLSLGRGSVREGTGAVGIAIMPNCLGFTKKTSTSSSIGLDTRRLNGLLVVT